MAGNQANGGSPGGGERGGQQALVVPEYAGPRPPGKWYQLPPEFVRTKETIFSLVVLTGLVGITMLLLLPLMLPFLQFCFSNLKLDGWWVKALLWIMGVPLAWPLGKLRFFRDWKIVIPLFLDVVIWAFVISWGVTLTLYRLSGLFKPGGIQAAAVGATGVAQKAKWAAAKGLELRTHPMVRPILLLLLAVVISLGLWSLRKAIWRW